MLSDRTDGWDSEETIEIIKFSLFIQKQRERLAKDATQPSQDWNPEPLALEGAVDRGPAGGEG